MLEVRHRRKGVSLKEQGLINLGVTHSKVKCLFGGGRDGDGWDIVDEVANKARGVPRTI